MTIFKKIKNVHFNTNSYIYFVLDISDGFYLHYLIYIIYDDFIYNMLNFLVTWLSSIVANKLPF